MATTKTLQPTNVTISIPEFTDQPDQRVNSNCIDKEADAINALSVKIQTSWFDTSADSSGNIQLKHNGDNIPSTAFVASVFIEGSMIGIPFVKQSDSTWICKVLSSNMSPASSGTATRVHLVVIYP